MGLSKLTSDFIDVYLQMIGSDHHKSCDGYFEIRLVYNGYSTKPYEWEAVHEGYINRGEFFAGSYEDAEKGLQKMVCDFIQDQIETYEKVMREPDEWDIMFPVNMVELIEKFNLMKEGIDA